MTSALVINSNSHNFFASFSSSQPPLSPSGLVTYLLLVVDKIAIIGMTSPFLLPLLPNVLGSSSKSFKKERVSKITDCGSNHLRDIHIVFKLDIDGLPTLR
jgi:hypothetical protein